MKPRHSLIFGSVAALAIGSHAARAVEPQVIDLGNGSKVQIKDGQVSVQSSSDSTSGPAAAPGGATGSSTSSATSITRTDTGGGSVTTVTTDRNGQRVTRTITVDKDGKVTVSEPGSAPAAPSSAASPAPAPAPTGGWLGVHSIEVSDALRAQIDIPEDQGIVLEFVAAGGPAETAGLRANDIVLSLDGAPVKGVDDFRARLGQTKPGQPVAVEYLRKGKTATVTATLGQRPADAAPGAKVAEETSRLLRQLESSTQAIRRGIVIDGQGEAHVLENEDPFELLLNDPNVPESMKAHIRESRDLLRQALPAEAKKEKVDPDTPDRDEPDEAEAEASKPEAPAEPPAEKPGGSEN